MNLQEGAKSCRKRRLTSLDLLCLRIGKRHFRCPRFITIFYTVHRTDEGQSHRNEQWLRRLRMSFPTCYLFRIAQDLVVPTSKSVATYHQMSWLALTFC